MPRARLYLLLCVAALLLESLYIIANAPGCIRCHRALPPTEVREVPELCRPCIEELRKILAPSSYRPPYPVNPSDPAVVLVSERGEIAVELFSDKAPLSTGNFLQYVRTGRYDGMLVDRVETYLLTTGGIVGPAGPSYDSARMPPIDRFPPIPSESGNGLGNLRGTLALSRQDDDPSSASSHFFFNLVDRPDYDKKGTAAREAGYAVFGQVLRGIELLDAVSREPTAGAQAPWKGYEKMPLRPFRFDRVFEVPIGSVAGVAPLSSAAVATPVAPR